MHLMSFHVVNKCVNKGKIKETPDKMTKISSAGLLFFGRRLRVLSNFYVLTFNMFVILFSKGLR